MTNDRETGNGTPKADNAETSWGNGVMIAVTNTQMQGPDPPVGQTYRRVAGRVTTPATGRV